MTEYCDVERATRLANMRPEKFQPILDLWRDRSSSSLKALHASIKKWAMQHAENGDKGVTFQYRYAEGKSFGRMSSQSITSIPKDVRGYMCQSEAGVLMTDIDMCNAHPVILEWLCHRHGLACPKLSHFVTHREECMERVMELTHSSRDEVKRIFLCCVNMQGSVNARDQFLVEFDQECKTLQQAFLVQEEYKYMLEHAERAAVQKLEDLKAQRRKERRTVNGLTANIAGSFINLVLCTWENRFLGTACETLKERGIEICANCYDGCLIRGDHYPAEGNRDEVICPALEQALLDRYGVRMTWTMKRHSSMLKWDSDEEIGTLKYPYTTYRQQWLDRIIRVGSHYTVRLQSGQEVTETAAQIEQRLRGETARCFIPDKKRNFADALLSDPDLRTYEACDMYPRAEDCPPYIYNTWKPMPCETLDVALGDPKSENVRMVRRLIGVLSDHKSQVMRYIELFIAHMLIYPEVKPGTFLVLMSQEGAGKGTLVEVLTALMGRSKVKELNNVQRSLLGPFNGALIDAFLIVLDEAQGKHLYDGGEELKNLITASEYPVNQKGIPERMVTSYTRWIVTIQPRPVPTKKGDRRAVISRCSDVLVGDRAFFTEIRERLTDPQMLLDLNAYFRGLKPPRVFGPEHTPITEVQRDMQEGNADIFESWVADVCERWIGTDTDKGLRDWRNQNCDVTVLDTRPHMDLKSLYANFIEYAPPKVAETMRYQTFVARFSLCRWCKAFGRKVSSSRGSQFPRHKLNGMQLQCREWDMRRICRDLDLPLSEKRVEALVLQFVQRMLLLKKEADRKKREVDQQKKQEVRQSSAPWRNMKPASDPVPESPKRALSSLSSQRKKPRYDAFTDSFN